ncbi:DUF362 domain-containing protein [Candidatus Saganbacteria bacterium]|nr:DUF362 domain-containing protein [Candidatus Saganbacteria bacterium]
MKNVFYADSPTSATILFDKCGFPNLINFGDPVALKVHFGEPGNTAYLKPQRVNGIRDKVKELGGKPFFSDANTLYGGPRSNSKEHREVAGKHGFSDVIISEEDDCVTVPVNLKHFKQVYLAGAAMRAPAMMVLTHFKGHELTGFGGALKNVGMGLGTRKGKLKMHQDCLNCPEVKTCKKNLTIESCWIGSPTLVQEKLVEYVYGAVKGKQVGYINFIIDISPNCDCYAHNDPPVVPDIGILASLDPVAIDQASVDLVNKAAGHDVFRKLYPAVNWNVQLDYAETIGLGSREYNIIYT